jgi:hypothetical protein
MTPENFKEIYARLWQWQIDHGIAGRTKEAIGIFYGDTAGGDTAFRYYAENRGTGWPADSTFCNPGVSEGAAPQRRHFRSPRFNGESPHDSAAQPLEPGPPTGALEPQLHQCMQARLLLWNSNLPG